MHYKYIIIITSNTVCELHIGHHTDGINTLYF